MSLHKVGYIGIYRYNLYKLFLNFQRRNGARPLHGDARTDISGRDNSESNRCLYRCRNDGFVEFIQVEIRRFQRHSYRHGCPSSQPIATIGRRQRWNNVIVLRVINRAHTNTRLDIVEYSNEEK